MAEIKVKICGLSDKAGVTAAVTAGADYLGFVLVPESRRYVNNNTVESLLSAVSSSAKKVALVCNPAPASLAAVKWADYIQFHGDESYSDIARWKQQFQFKVIKAVTIANRSDIEKLNIWNNLVDMLLLDAPAPASSKTRGGNAVSWDWQLMATGQQPDLPWFLAGGLTVANLNRAATITGASYLDVSSGVESRPGIKSPAMIRQFIETAKSI